MIGELLCQLLMDMNDILETALKITQGISQLPNNDQALYLAVLDSELTLKYGKICERIRNALDEID